MQTTIVRNNQLDTHSTRTIDIAKDELPVEQNTQIKVASPDRQVDIGLDLLTNKKKMKSPNINLDTFHVSNNQEHREKLRYKRYRFWNDSISI